MSEDAGNGVPRWGGTPAAGNWGSPSPAATFNGPNSAMPGNDGGSPISAPIQWLGIAALLEAMGLVLGVFAEDKPAFSVAGWLIGGFGAMSMLAAFTLADSRRRTSTWYAATSSPAIVRAALAVGAVLTVALNAYYFADWASRL